MKMSTAELLDVLHTMHKRIERLRETEAASTRVVIALASIPGSGKSTIATALLEHLRLVGHTDVAVVPMVS